MKGANSPNCLADCFEHPRFNASSGPAQVFFVDAKLRPLHDTIVESRGKVDKRCIAPRAHLLHGGRDLAQYPFIKGNVAVANTRERPREAVLFPA